HISFRLLAALEAGQAAGGDTRGMQSAAMIVVKEDGGVWLNNDVVLRLQVDDSPEPIAELRRLGEIAAAQRERFRRASGRRAGREARGGVAAGIAVDRTAFHFGLDGSILNHPALAGTVPRRVAGAFAPR